MPSLGSSAPRFYFWSRQDLLVAAVGYAGRSGCEATARAGRRWRGWLGPVRRGFIQALRNQGPWRPCTQACGSPESARRQASRGIVDPGLSLDYVTTVLAALLAGAGFVLQQRAAAMEPASRFPSIRLIIDLVRQPRWLAGIGLLAAGGILAAFSIGPLGLSLAAPPLGTYLIFARRPRAPPAGHAPRPPAGCGGVPPGTPAAPLTVRR